MFPPLPTCNCGTCGKCRHRQSMRKHRSQRSSHQAARWASHNDYSPAVTAWARCPYCTGSGIDSRLTPTLAGIGRDLWKPGEGICDCAYRGAFLRTYSKYVHLRENAFDAQPVRLKAVEFIADFETAAKRSLRDDPCALEAFHFRFRMGWPEEAVRFHLKRHRDVIEEDTLRAMASIGREITTMAPYPLFPSARYFQGGPLLESRLRRQVQAKGLNRSRIANRNQAVISAALLGRFLSKTR